MQFIFAKAGLQLPRTAREQQKVAIPVSDPVPGDLVFYNTPATHVALYLGNGRMLAAPRPGSNVRVQDVYGSPMYGRITGAGTGKAGQIIEAVTNPVTAAGGAVLDKLADSGKVLMFTAAGAVLVLVGLWAAVKKG
jgi:hypothetical protein